MEDAANEQAHTHPPRRRRRLLWDLLIVGVVVLGLRAYQQRNLPDGPAPALAGYDVAGAAVDLGEYRGQPVLVHFWATWCGVCTAEAPNVQALSEDLPVVSVVSLSGRPAQVAAEMRDAGLSFPAVHDPGGRLARRFGVRAFPTSFVLDADGRIRHAEVGYTTELGLRARMWLAAL